MANNNKEQYHLVFLSKAVLLSKQRDYVSPFKRELRKELGVSIFSNVIDRLSELHENDQISSAVEKIMLKHVSIFFEELGLQHIQFSKDKTKSVELWFSEDNGCFCLEHSIGHTTFTRKLSKLEDALGYFVSFANELDQ